MLTFALLAAIAASVSPPQTPNDVARWERQAQSVTIIRDDWGIAHVYGHTDADAVFGMVYAQAEDDFNRVETNYLNAMGRLAEAEGESRVYQDLRMKLFIDPDSMRALYAASPAWLKALMNAWADGLNFYLYKHPEVKPRVIRRFEPWMALTFSEGSIGGDIERVSLRDLEAFYGAGPSAPVGTGGEGDLETEPTGSNGIAIAPANTVNHHALLLINPHTSFFFRAEVQVVSDEGLDAYGAVTWGQFFVYQGFNDRAGWMHTSSGVDAIDEYLETVVQHGGRYAYRYGAGERPMIASTITVLYKTATGMARKTFTVYRTHHGPIVRKAGDRWVSVRLMQEPLKALIQSYTRTKARDYQAFRRSMELHTNSSNNTIFADAAGDIAYFHANFIPRRDTTFDWTKPVDGSTPATEWHGVLSVDETPHLLNPASGWLYNSNNWPWSAAFDPYLPWFEKPIPALVAAWDQAAADHPLKAKLAEPIALLRAWDLRWSATSIPTSLAVFWGETLGGGVERATPDQLLQALSEAVDKLNADFGTWKTPWGDINRFQRLTGDIVQPFSDSGPSIPVPFTSSRWGSLAAFGARAYTGTKRWYGTSGNSFVAVVEFGDSVRARAVTAGGESGHAGNPHFNDEAGRYAAGDLRTVYFYRSQLVGHTEREYHPGR